MDSRTQVIEDNLLLVRSIASKFKVSNIGLDCEDLVNIGLMGLLDAYDKYDATKGAKFTTYATLRIKSYMIDEIRKLSPISRSDMNKVKVYNNSVSSLYIVLNREPTIEEVAKKMGVTIKDVESIMEIVGMLNITSIDEEIGGSEDTLITLKDTIESVEWGIPSSVVEEEEKVTLLAKCLDKLKDRDKILLSLYYYEELTLKEVGMVMGLSESRVCVLHNRALMRLKGILKNSNYAYVEESVI